MIYTLIKVSFDVILVAILGICTPEVIENVPWLHTVRSSYETGGACFISYKAIGIPEWVINWKPTQPWQLTGDDSGSILRVSIE